MPLTSPIPATGRCDAGDAGDGGQVTTPRGRVGPATLRSTAWSLRIGVPRIGSSGSKRHVTLDRLLKAPFHDGGLRGPT